MNSRILRSAVPILAVGLCGIGGCVSGDKPMRVESRLDGNMAATLKLEGPVTVQMQGPTIHYEGTQISDELLDRVKPGTTTEEWALAVFGEPTARAELKDGTAILRWTYRPVDQQGSLLQVFGGSESEPKLASQTVFLHVRGGVVIDKWKG